MTGTTKRHESTRIRTDARSRDRAFVFLVLLTCLAFASCRPASENEARRLAEDAAATAELNRINTLLASHRPVTRLDIESLNGLRKKYPGSDVVRQLLQGALIKREDWAAAEAVVAGIPETERTTGDRLNLGKIYLKQGRFADAARVLASIPADAPEGIEIAALKGQAQFYGGETDAAVATLESIREDLILRKRADELAILGTIYFRRAEHLKAIDVLQQAVAIAPDNVAANNALGRVYTASGDNEKAEIYRQRLAAISERTAAAQKRKSRLVPLFYQLEDAYAAKEFDKVIAIVRQIEPEADDATKATLYQYLAAAYQEQGKDAEAKNALAEAAKLTQK
jgi:tetratricopeptide (TPR) repeat protein